jgi:septal ring factor EnvC (AmiA/AmiB activator)
MYKIDLDTLARANSIVDNRSIARGQVLTIPAQALQPGAAAVPSAGPAVNASFAWPARGQVLSRFGDQVDTGTNKGIDISAKEGSRVTASMDGKVVYCDPQFKGFGQTVILDHAGGYQTVYSYNSEILVRTGEQVRQGQTIARAGQSGRASRPMLHFEIRRDGQPQNPSRYLAE